MHVDHPPTTTTSKSFILQQNPLNVYFMTAFACCQCLLSIVFVVDATLHTSPTDQRALPTVRVWVFQLDLDAGLCLCCVPHHTRVTQTFSPHLLGVASVPSRCSRFTFLLPGLSRIVAALLPVISNYTTAAEAVRRDAEREARGVYIKFNPSLSSRAAGRKRRTPAGSV